MDRRAGLPGDVFDDLLAGALERAAQARAGNAADEPGAPEPEQTHGDQSLADRANTTAAAADL